MYSIMCSLSFFRASALSSCSMALWATRWGSFQTAFTCSSTVVPSCSGLSRLWWRGHHQPVCSHMDTIEWNSSLATWTPSSSLSSRSSSLQQLSGDSLHLQKFILIVFWYQQFFFTRIHVYIPCTCTCRLHVFYCVSPIYVHVSNVVTQIATYAKIFWNKVDIWFSWTKLKYMYFKKSEIYQSKI